MARFYAQIIGTEPAVDTYDAAWGQHFAAIEANTDSVLIAQNRRVLLDLDSVSYQTMNEDELRALIHTVPLFEEIYSLGVGDGRYS